MTGPPQMPLPGFGGAPHIEEGPLVQAARASIQARRDQGAIQPWHETLCAAVIELAQQVQVAKGIAKAQLYAQMLAAEAKLPEPMIQEAAGVLEFEGDRIRRFLDEYDARLRDSADVPHAEEPAPVQ